jgi:hypothetical protein
VFDDPNVKKNVDVRIRLDSFVIEAFPDLITSLFQLSPAFKGILIKGDLVNLGQKHVRYLAHHAAMEHLKASLFPARNGIAFKSSIREMPSLLQT